MTSLLNNYIIKRVVIAQVHWSNDPQFRWFGESPTCIVKPFCNSLLQPRYERHGFSSLRTGYGKRSRLLVNTLTAKPIRGNISPTADLFFLITEKQMV